MAVPVRYTQQKQQELRSIPQIKERLVEFGWLPTRPEEDLGEDLQVHIYFEGKATGVLFHLQAKSITNLYERRKDESLPYPFKVKDLLHWEQFELPVVLMVWDVHLRQGRWALWNTAVLQLNRQNLGWREQKTATIYLPWQNRTDDEGLIELRKEIGFFLFPQISRRNPLREFKFKTEFTNDAKGKAKLETFENITKYGGTGTLTSEMEWPEEFKQWFGPSTSATLTMHPPAHPKTYAVSLELTGNGGETVSFKTELKTLKPGGLESSEISNEHLPSAFFHIFFTIPNHSRTFQLNLKTNPNVEYLGRDANEAYEHLKALYFLGAGCTIRLNFPFLDDPSLFTATIAPNPDVAPPPIEMIKLVKMLRVIQNKTKNYFAVPFTKWSDEDVHEINKLFAILTCGKRTLTNLEITLEVNYKAATNELLDILLKIHRQGKRIEGLSAEYESSYFDPFGIKIQTGRMTRFMSGKLGLSVSEFEKAIASLKPGQAMQIKLVDGDVTEIYPDWFIKEAERLAYKLAENFEVEAIYLFGSLVWGEQWNPQTDIDLAVSGLAPEKYFKAIGYLEGETKFPFNLVDLAIAPDSLRERILQKGKLLIECKRVAEIS